MWGRTINGLAAARSMDARRGTRATPSAKEEEANRRMLRLAEDDCAAAPAAASWSLQSGLDLHLRLRGLQSGAHAKPRGRSSCSVSRGRSVSPSTLKIALGGYKSTENQPFRHRSHENNEGRKGKGNQVRR